MLLGAAWASAMLSYTLVLSKTLSPYSLIEPHKQASHKVDACS